MEKGKKGFSVIIPLFVIIIVLLIAVIALLLSDKILTNEKSKNNYNNSSNITNDSSNTSDRYIEKQKALSIALEHAQLAEKDIYDVKVELDYKYQTTVYEIDFNYKQYEYEYYIDAQTGEILHSFKEWD